MQNVSGSAYATGGHGIVQEGSNRVVDEDARSAMFSSCPVSATSVPHQPGESLSGSFSPDGEAGNVSPRGALEVPTPPGRSVASVFTRECIDGHHLSLQRTSQQLSSGPRSGGSGVALPGGGGDARSAASASDGTVQCSEFSTMRNPSTSPMNSPLPQMNMATVSGSVAFPPASCLTPLHQLTTFGANTIRTAIPGTNSGGLGANATLETNSGSAAVIGEAEEARPSGAWRIEPETLKQEVMQGFASKNPHLPTPVRVTVGPNAFRQQQQQPLHQQQSLLSSLLLPQSATKKRSREAAGSPQQLWCSGDADDSDGQKKRGIVCRGPGGRGARQESDSVEEKHILYGTFYPDRYMVGVDCILVDGMFVSRSRFEKLGGSLMAKWYRSIRVVETAEPLGTWLDRHGLPVFTGKARQRRQRATPSAKVTGPPSVPVAPVASVNVDPAPISDKGKVQGSSNNLGLVTYSGACNVSGAGAWSGTSSLEKDAQLSGSTGQGRANVEPVGPRFGRNKDGPSITQGIEHLSEKPSSLDGALSAENSGRWQGLGRASVFGNGSAAFGLQTLGSHSVDTSGNVSAQPQPLRATDASAGALSGPSAFSTPAAAADASSSTAPVALMGVVASGMAAPQPKLGSAACNVMGASGSNGSGQASTTDPPTRAAYTALETLPNGAVAPGVYLIGGKVPTAGLSMPQTEQLRSQHVPQRLPLPQTQLQHLHNHQQGLHQQLHGLQQEQHAHLQQCHQRQQATSCDANGGWRSRTDGDAPVSAHIAASTLAHHSLKGHDGPNWGNNEIFQADAVAAASAEMPLQRLGSDGGSGPAVASHLSVCSGVASQPLAVPHTCAPAASEATGSGGANDGAGGSLRMDDQVLTRASSCRLPEITSLELVSNSTANPWPGTCYPPVPGTGYMVQYGAYDENNDAACGAGRHVWDAEPWHCPYDTLPSSASAPVKLPIPKSHEVQQLQQQQEQQEEDQQHQIQQQKLHSAMSMQTSYEVPRSAGPACWVMRTKKTLGLRARDELLVQSPFLNVQQHGQQACWQEGSPFPLVDGVTQSALKVDNASAGPVSPEARHPSTPSGMSLSAGAGSTANPAAANAQKPDDPYATASRQWPYASQYWPYPPYAGHGRSGPGLAARHSVGPGNAVRPYYRGLQPREMPHSGGMAPAPAPLPSPYGCYYPAPYLRRIPAMYRRRYTVSAPGTAEAQPGLLGTQYDTMTTYGSYAPVRPEMEPLIRPSGPAAQQPKMGELVDHLVPVANVSGRASATSAQGPYASRTGTAAMALDAVSASKGGHSSNGTPAARQADLQYLPIPQQQRQQMIQSQPQPQVFHQQHPQSHHRVAQASASTSGWPIAPFCVQSPPTHIQFPHPMCEVSQEPQIRGGLVDADSSPAGFRCAGASSASRVGAASAITVENAPNPFAGQSGFMAAAVAMNADAASLTSGACGADADVDPMWAHFQRWSTEESGRAPQCT